MRREHLAHVLRAASQIADERDVVVFGSQAVLGAHDEDELPEEATLSMEADLTFWNDPDDERSDRVDGAIGEDSYFHQTHGYYAQGVSITTATLPDGWQDRLIRFENASTKPARGWCLEPHDLALAKLVAWREKDTQFVRALIEAGLLDCDLLLQRCETLPIAPLLKKRIARWIALFT